MNRSSFISLTLIFIALIGIWAVAENGSLTPKKPENAIVANLCQELQLLSEKITTLDKSYEENSAATHRYQLATLRTRYHRTERFLKREYPNTECPHANN